MAEHFSLRWNNFHRNMSSGFRTLLMEDSLVDVTLAADGRFVQAHRLVLSVCSPYFKNLFSATPCHHPIVIMKDVHFKQLTDILSFMYQGEVNVHQEELADFLKTAELLQIRGLADQNVEDVTSTTLKQVLSQSVSPEPSGAPLSDGPPILSQGTKPLERVSGPTQTVFDPSQDGSSANKTPAASTAAAHTLFSQSPSSSLQAPQITVREGPSAAMFIGVQVKEEVPDDPSEPEQDVDAHEYLTGDQGVDETSLDAPVILRNGEKEHSHVLEKSLCTAAPAQDGARKNPARPISKSDKEISCAAEELPKRRYRKQRMLALNKIRRFLVTPKRSRRIAFARKMKGKKDVVLKSGLTSENVSDVSKQLSAISRNTVNIKTCVQAPNLHDHIYAAPASRWTAVSESENKFTVGEKEEDNKDDDKKQFKEQDSKKSECEDSKKKIDTLDKRKTKANTTVKAKKYRTMNNDDKKNETKNNTKNKKETGRIINRGSSELRKTNVNKKKIIVVIAAKKTKSAVALARKMQSSVRGRTTMTNKPGSIERTVSGATVHLRSSAPQSTNSSKDSTGTATNGQACRHLGCLGCRGGN